MLVTGLDTLVVWEEVGAEAGLLLGLDTADVDGLTDTDGVLTELLDGALTELLAGLLADGLLTELLDGLLTELLDGLLDAVVSSTRGRSLIRGVCVWTAA
jgi:hypothetical protein